MSVDREAIIAQQLADQKLREAIPGRYDGATIADLPARVRDVHADIASWRQAHEQPEPPADQWDLALRELGIHNVRANAAYGLRATMAHPVVAVSDDGRPLTEPTMDLEQIVGMWSPGGLYADRWPGVACVEGGLYALAVWGRGVEWLRDLRKVAVLSRRERIEAWAKAQPLDPVDELGVPGPISDWDMPDETPRAPEIKPTFSYPLRLVEQMPAHVPVTRAWLGGLQSREGQAAMAAAKGRQPRLMEWMCWTWPKGLALPTGALREGVASQPVLPAEGAVLNFGGSVWRVNQWPLEAFLNPPPEWLVEALS
jgi:hypothetical protein